MRHIRITVAFGIFTILATALLVWRPFSIWPPAASDASLQARFRAHELKLLRLVSMFRTDSGFKSVSVAYVPSQTLGDGSAHSTRIEMPVDRWQQYVRLLSEAGVRSIERDGASIHFIVSVGTDGWNTQRKGFSYLESAPATLHQSLHHIRPGTPTPAYRALQRPHWYVSYFWEAF